MAQKSEPIIIHPNELHLHSGCLRDEVSLSGFRFQGYAPYLQAFVVTTAYDSVLALSPSCIHGPYAFYRSQEGAIAQLLAREALLGASAGISLIALPSRDRSKKMNQIISQQSTWLVKREGSSM